MRAGECAATAKTAKHWGVFLINVTVFTPGAQEHGQSTLGNRQHVDKNFKEHRLNRLCLCWTLACSILRCSNSDISRWRWSPQTLLRLRTSGKNPLCCPLPTSMAPRRHPLPLSCLLSLRPFLCPYRPGSHLWQDRREQLPGPDPYLSDALPLLCRLFPSPVSLCSRFTSLASFTLVCALGLFVHIRRKTHLDFHLSALC